jgi:PKD repeat protein
MKSRTLVPLALGLMLVGTASWSSDAWSVVLGGSWQRTLKSVCVLPDGGAAVAGWDYNDDGQAIWVARLSADGQPLWEKAFRNDLNGYATQVAASGSGELLVSGAITLDIYPYTIQAFVGKLDASGNKVWHVTLTEAGGGPATSLCPLSDGGCLVAGTRLDWSSGGYAGWIARLTAEGALLWREMLPGLTSVSVEGAGGGGKFVLTGSLYRDPAAPWLALMDGDGHLQWQREFAGGTLCAAPTPNGGVVAVNARQVLPDPTWVVDVMAIDSQGSVTWQRAFQDLNQGWHYPGLAVLPDGKIVAAVATDMFSQTYGDTDTWLLCLDPTGQVLWQNLLGQTGPDDLSLLAAMPDGGLLSAGHPPDDSVWLSTAAWLLRMPPGGPGSLSCSFVRTGALAEVVPPLPPVPSLVVTQAATGAFVPTDLHAIAPGSSVSHTCPSPACQLACQAVAVPAPGESLEASFQATSDGADCGPPTYTWSFGDGTQSTGASVTHNYSSKSTYSWTLEVEAGGQGCSRQGVIRVGNPPCVLGCSASGSPAAGGAPLTVRFQSGIRAPDCEGGATYQWDFGDGTQSTEAHPSHTYANAGTFMWRMRANVGGDPCDRTGLVEVADVIRAQWIRSYQLVDGGVSVDQGPAVAVAPSLGGAIVVAGNAGRLVPYGSWARLLSLDASGTPLSQVLYTRDGHETVADVDGLPDGGSVLCGITYKLNGYDVDGWVLNAGPDGAFRWAMALGNLPSVDILSTVSTVRAMTDGGCVVLGKTEPPDLDFKDLPFVARFGPAGDLLWLRSYTKKLAREEYKAVAALSDGGLIVGGRTNQSGNYMLALRLDSEGNVLWKRGVYCGVDGSAQAVAALADGRIGIAGYTATRMNVATPHLAMLDASGRLLWARLYAIGETASFTGVMPGPDGGLLVTGKGMGIGGNGASLRFLLKVDASGKPLGFVLLQPAYSDPRLTSDGSLVSVDGQSVFGIQHLDASASAGDGCSGTDQPLPDAAKSVSKTKPLTAAVQTPPLTATACTFTSDASTSVDITERCHQRCSISAGAQASPTRGQAPLDVAFQSVVSSSGCSGPVSLLWDFGDGTSSALTSPNHTYSAPGIYRWRLTAAAGGSSSQSEGSVVVGDVEDGHWAKIYSNWCGEYGTARACPGGGFLVQGQTGCWSGMSPAVGAVDAGGAVLWQTIFRGEVPSMLSWVEPLSDSGAATAGVLRGKVWVARLDAAGGMLWSKAVGSEYWAGLSRIRENRLHDLFLVGVGRDTLSAWTGRVLKADAFGTTLWETEIAGPGWFYLMDLQPTEDGGCVVAGYLEAAPNRAYLAKIGPAGEMLWQREFFAPITCAFLALHACADGTWVAVGRARTSYSLPEGIIAMSLRPDGTPLWSRVYQSDTAGQPIDIQPLDGGGFVLGTRDTKVLRLLPDGSLASCRAVGDADETLLSLDRMADGQVVAFGPFALGHSYPQRAAFLMTFDADGNGPAGCGAGSSCTLTESDPLIQQHLSLCQVRRQVPASAEPDCMAHKGQPGETDLCAGTACMLTCAAEAWRDPLTPIEGWFRVAVDGDLCALGPSITWDFGDGVQGWDKVVRHAYSAPGSYGWKVTVTWDGRSWSAEGTLTVGPE